MKIDFGFEFGQVNELWLNFDTRPEAEPDGSWTQQVNKIRGLKRPVWPIWHELPDDEVVYFVDLVGKWEACQRVATLVFAAFESTAAGDLRETDKGPSGETNIK